MTKRDLIVLCIGAALGFIMTARVVHQVLLDHPAQATPVCVDIPPLPSHGIHEVSLHSAP